MKKCKICGDNKPLNEIAWQNKTKGYKRNECKVCLNKVREIKRSKNLSKEALRIRNKALKKKYNMTQDDYLRIYSIQEGRCKICNDFQDVLNIDHCHKTGRVRALLCRYCNYGLGNFKDRSDLLLKAMKYLTDTNTDKSIY